MNVIEVESKEELSQQVRNYIALGYRVKRSSAGTLAHMYNSKSKDNVVIKINKSGSAAATISPGRAAFSRVVTTKTQSELDLEVHHLLVAGYITSYLPKGESDGAVRMIKKRKISGAWLCFWLLFGVIGDIIYLIWVKRAKPLDDVIIKVGEDATTNE